MNRLFLAAIAALLLLCAYVTKAAATVTTTSTPKDTILLKMKKGEKLMIITGKNQVGVKSLTEYDLNRVIKQVDSVLSNTNSIIYTKDGKGQFTLKDTTINVTTSPLKEEKGHFKMTISRDSAKSITINFNNGVKDSTMKINKKKKRDGEKVGVYLNLGLNNWISRGSGKFPDAQGLPHGLRPLGSRYISIGTVKYFPFTKTSPVSFSMGLEVAWYNFMLSNEKFITLHGPDSVGFKPVADQPQFAGKDVNVIKSKLVESVIKVPVGLRFKLGKVSSIELGGYAGYRLGSHTKLKYEVDGNTRKDKDRDNFYLNNFQYGLRAQVKVYGVGFFGEYGLQPVFGRGPDLRTVAFGINLL